MDSQQYYSFCSDINDGDQLLINKFSEDELSEIMLSLVANHSHQYNSSFATNPNHYAASYGYGDTITGANMNAAMAMSSSSSLHDILINTTSSSPCSFESDRGSPPPPATAAAQCGINSNDGVRYSFSLGRDNEAILFNNITSGMIANVDRGSITTSFDAATCYGGQKPPPAANYVRAPSAAGAGDGDKYYGTTTKTQLCNNNDADVKVWQYTAEERKDRILRYLKKRNQRNFNKTIKYACRKTLADRRVRVRGRFARNSSSELSEEDISRRRPSENDGHQQYYRNENDVGTHHVQLADDSKVALEMMRREGGGGEEEDQWLQEAMASLLYAPYIAAG